MLFRSAGDVVLEGFTPIDRKLGSEVYPLNYKDGSVDEIYASHVLEHFKLDDIQAVLGGESPSPSQARPNSY